MVSVAAPIDQATGLRRLLSRSRPRVVAFVSTPRAGCTTVCLNLAAAAGQTGQKAVVLDCAGDSSTPGRQPAAGAAGVRLGSPHDPTAVDTVAAAADPSVEVVRAQLAADALAQLSPGKPSGFLQVLRQLGARADLMLVDTGRAHPCWIAAADEVVLVLRTHPDSVVDAYRHLKRLHTQTRLAGALVVLNCVENQAHVGRIFGNLCATAERFLQVRLELLGWIPEDERVGRAAGVRRTCVEAFPQSPAATAARACAAALAQRDSHREGSIDLVAHRLAAAARSIMTT